jgi:hypothetical protein
VSVRTHANVGAENALERKAYTRLCPASGRSEGTPPGKEAVTQIGETLVCRETDCHRRAHSLGWCTTHYRRWRSGKPMNAPIRRYRKRVRWRREGPFAAEYALLAELGLRRN